MCGASFPERFQRIIHKYEDNKEALFDAGMSYALSQIIDLLVQRYRRDPSLYDEQSAGGKEDL